MKNKKISIKTIVIIILMVINISLIYCVLNMKDKTIEGQEIAKEQLSETTQSNAYVSAADHFSELGAKQQEIDNIQNITNQANATEDDIYSGKKAYVKGNLITGKMIDNGALNGTIKPNETFPIPAGYTTGGEVKVNTTGTATAAQILKGKTAWVNGKTVTGTMLSLADQTADGDATESEILLNKIAYVDGKKVVGKMAKNSAVSAKLLAGQSVTIPKGYTPGGTVTTYSLADQTKGTATAADIVNGKTAWVNGTRITGTMSAGKNFATGAYQAGSTTGENSRKVTINNGTYIIYISCWTYGSHLANEKPTIALSGCTSSLLNEFNSIVEQDTGHRKFASFVAYKITVTNGSFTIKATHTPVWGNSSINTSYMIVPSS